MINWDIVASILIAMILYTILANVIAMIGGRNNDIE